MTPIQALAELVARCDGEEGVRADGSNIQTIEAHAALANYAPHDVANKVCAEFITRSIAQGMTGVARDRAALEFLIGACAMAHASGDKDAYDILSLRALLVSVRGFRELQRLVKAKEAA